MTENSWWTVPENRPRLRETVFADLAAMAAAGIAPGVSVDHLVDQIAAGLTNWDGHSGMGFVGWA